MDRVLAVIPARMGSTRFPGKPLAEIAGRSLIGLVCDRASRVPGLDRLLVATDDGAILDHVRSLGYEAVMTRAEHSSGSDRVAEAAEGWEGLVLNVQGDEPLLDPDFLGRLVGRLRAEPGWDLATAGVAPDPGDLENPDRVLVQVDEEGRALDFRRLWQQVPPRRGRLLRHAGVYLYRAAALARFVAAAPCDRERRESLEQLRALDLGMAIGVLEAAAWPPGVDRPEDLKVVAKLLGDR